ncbi:MAG: hypothetical protein Tsb0034_18300 [Ekhidna sp.]
MLKTLLTIYFIICFFLGAAQSDTLVVHDYTKIMIETRPNGETRPITTLKNVRQAGFFLNGLPEGRIRICNDQPVHVYVDGRLLDLVESCEVLLPERLLEVAASDSIFVSFYAENLSNLTCELIIFDELILVKEDRPSPRPTRDHFVEFTITATLILLLLLGGMTVRHPSRMLFISRRTFTLKASAYEFINTNFMSGPGVFASIFLALNLGFLGVYLETFLDFGFRVAPESYTDYLVSWLRFSGIIALFILLKWLLVSLISKLYAFRNHHNFQLFDFVNFMFIISLGLLVLVVLDFVFHPPGKSWFTDRFKLILLLLFISYLVWYTLKFVNNSSRTKLLIISYLCATEIIPAILIVGWFYK